MLSKLKKKLVEKMSNAKQGVTKGLYQAMKSDMIRIREHLEAGETLEQDFQILWANKKGYIESKAKINKQFRNNPVKRRENTLALNSLIEAIDMVLTAWNEYGGVTQKCFDGLDHLIETYSLIEEGKF